MNDDAEQGQTSALLLEQGLVLDLAWAIRDGVDETIASAGRAIARFVYSWASLEFGRRERFRSCVPALRRIWRERFNYSSI
jgi:hypothetical protein